MKKNQKGYLLSCTVPSCKSVWWVPKFVKAGEGLHGHTCCCVSCQNNPQFAAI